MAAGAVSRDHLNPSVVEELGRIDLIADVIANGVLRGLRKSRRYGFSTEFSDYKAYVAGDDPRYLDWRRFARTNKLFVKRFEAETDLEVLLLLDASGSMAWRWEQTTSKLEYAANLLGALAALHMRQQDRVGLLVHDANEVHYLPPRCKRSQRDEIFSILEGVSPGSGDTFPLLVEQLAAIKRHQGVIIICTDLEESGEEIERALALLAGREDELILFHLLDRAEVELPFRDATHLRDAETGELLAVDMDTVRRNHAAGLEQFRSRWETLCDAWRTRYIPIDTSTSYVDAICDMVESQRK